MTQTGNQAHEPIHLEGAVWMKVGDANLGGHGRVGLLRAIAEKGSITQAAKAIGMSYKAAWDAVDTMNNLAGEPLLERSSGGKGGGSTQLTERGLQLIARFSQIEAIHRQFVHMLSHDATDLAADLDLLRTLNMKTSARNQFSGVVTALTTGAVNDEIELTLGKNVRIVAIVTRESTESLGLKVGSQAFALIKASSVIIACDLEGTKLSARNQLCGTVRSVTPGAVNAEVVLEIDGGGSIAAIVTNPSIHSLGLETGTRAVAIFKASSVILGTMA
ncbi:MAG: molybdenum-dependent transcriptional regulator [Herminiimonas sp.]|nr:molybdenum-dependent transcriptional regulator [Herminiimonas sp.]